MQHAALPSDDQLAHTCRYLIMHLAELGNWKVYALSRKDKLHYEEVPNGLPEDKIIPVKVGYNRCNLAHS